MKKRFGTMALMAITLLCSAMTCSGGDEIDERSTSDTYLALPGTTWESTSWQRDNQVYSDYEDRQCLTITFSDTTYTARLESYKTGAYGTQTSGPSHYFGGDYKFSDTFIAGKYYIRCYDGNSNQECIRFEVMSQGSTRMEGKVYLPTLGETYRVVMTRI